MLEATNQAVVTHSQETAKALVETAQQAASAVKALAEESTKKKDAGEVELHKMIKSPDIFQPSSFKEERDQ